MKNRITVLIIEDSALMRRELTEILNSDQDLRVIGTARDGIEGLELAKQFDPDVVTIDINLPRMDGITCLQYIMLESPRPCLIISAHTARDSIETFEALELGAVDFVQKPSGEISRNIATSAEEIIRKVKGAVQVNLSVMTRQKTAMPDRQWIGRHEGSPTPEQVVVIGVSTGGPRALMQIIPALPYDLDAPVLIIQHMPGAFTTKFAARLDDHSLIQVKEAENGEPLRNGVVYVAPGDSDLSLFRHVVHSGVAIGIANPPPDSILTPSVEEAMSSAVSIFRERTIGVILTGMGNDGANAMEVLHGLGGITIAESRETAVVYGMPKEVITRGVAKIVAPIHKIAEEIVEAVQHVQRSR